jgi:hypothetical protein
MSQATRCDICHECQPGQPKFRMETPKLDICSLECLEAFTAEQRSRADHAKRLNQAFALAAATIPEKTQ